MLDRFLQTNWTNWQTTTNYWSANCMFKMPWCKNIHYKAVSFTLQSAQNTYWHMEKHIRQRNFSHWNWWECFWALQRVEKDVPSKYIHFTASPTLIFWPESEMCEEGQKGPFSVLPRSSPGVTFGSSTKGREEEPCSHLCGFCWPPTQHQERLPARWNRATWGIVSFLL